MDWWIANEALDHGASVYVRVVDGELAAFFGIQSTTASLRIPQARRLGFPKGYPVPGALVTHIARAKGFPGYGREAMMYAASIARRVDAVQRTAILIVEPYDAETEAMWRDAFHFWSTQDRLPNGCRRLYHPVPRARNPPGGNLE